MYEGRGVLGTAWWVTVPPGVLLAITGVSLSLIADNLLSNQRRSV